VARRVASGGGGGRVGREGGGGGAGGLFYVVLFNSAGLKATRPRRWLVSSLHAHLILTAPHIPLASSILLLLPPLFLLHTPAAFGACQQP
jgi:hypothetical protein